MRYEHTEYDADQSHEDTQLRGEATQPLPPAAASHEPGAGEQRYKVSAASTQNRQTTQEQRRNFSRRKLLIAGAAATGLVAATSLGIIEVKQFLQGAGEDILGSFYLGNSQRRHQQLVIQQPFTTPQDIVIFAGQLSRGWNDWSWGQHQIVTQPAFTDGSPVIKFNPSNSGGLYFSHSPINVSGFGFFQFWVNGGSVGGQQLMVGMSDQAYNFTNEVLINDYIQGGFIQLNEWRPVRIPLAAMQSADNLIGGVIIRDATNALQPTVFLADLRLVHLLDSSEPILLAGDAPDLNAILLFFDRQMRADDVQTPRFYQISSLQDERYLHPVHPTRVQYHTQNKSVSLYVPRSMRAGKQYQVSVGRIRSKDGPALPDASSVTVTAQALELTIDVSKRGPTISPYIYGVNNAPNNGYLADLRPGLNRWGGENTSRYNWKLGNAFNAAQDYYFQNGNYGHTSPADRQPSGVADQFIQGNRDNGIETLLTIPNLGWVAKDDRPTSASINVPSGGPPIKPGSDISIAHGVIYDPTENRRRTSVPSRARKGAPFRDPPDLNDPTVAQDEWVYHLVHRFGPASNGGVRLYAMDNEPELWFRVQRDVRPAQIGYDQELSIFLDYATAVKDVDPSALITGPVTWGWPNYFYSSLDGGENFDFTKLVDFHAHGDIPFLKWWMTQIRKHDEATGRRNLDVLDIHFFSQTPYHARNRSDPQMRALRLRATRSLWDPTYKDESWINSYVQLIPRMQSWIAESYPGTKLGITEYNWGGEKAMDGALAQAEVLGIFSSSEVYLACYWQYPAPYSPVYYAFKLYTNYDGQGSRFGGTSIQATSTQRDTISCYAAEQKNGDVLVMVLNKHEQDALTPTIHLPHLGHRRVTAYQYGPDTKKPISQEETFMLSEETLRYTFPPYSITLLKMVKA